jgi:hypothetical protein
MVRKPELKSGNSKIRSRATANSAGSTGGTASPCEKGKRRLKEPAQEEVLHRKAKQSQPAVTTRNVHESLKSRLKLLEQVYNPHDVNLHFEQTASADAALYEGLLAIARETWEVTRQVWSPDQRSHSGKVFYLWYDLFLLASSAASRVSHDHTQKTISDDVMRRLVGVLIEASEWSTDCGGDIITRNYEALGNTVMAFYSKELLSLVRRKARDIGTRRVKNFVQWTIRRIAEVKEKGE